MRDPRIYPEDILLEIKRIRSFTEEIKNLEDLENNELVLYAVLKALENIWRSSKAYN